jgi:hypothetical protein
MKDSNTPVFHDGSPRTQVGSPMACKRWSSRQAEQVQRREEYSLPDRKGLDNPAVLLFPEVSICIDCGFAEFYVPAAEQQTRR